MSIPRRYGATPGKVRATRMPGKNKHHLWQKRASGSELARTVTASVRLLITYRHQPEVAGPSFRPATQAFTLCQALAYHLIHIARELTACHDPLQFPTHELLASFIVLAPAGQRR